MARIYKINTKRYEFVDVDSATVTSYILTEADHNRWLKLDTTSSSINLNLPDSLSDGFRCVIENTGTTTINYVNAVGTTIATQQDPFTEDQYRTVEAVFNAPTNEWRVQGFVGRNDISSLYDVNTSAGGTPAIGDILEFNGSVWTKGQNPPYNPNSVIAVDTILDEDDHAQIIPVDSSALPVDIAINTGLPAGFYCRVINIGTGTVTFTPAVSFNSPVVNITTQYSYVDIWHAGLEQYYVITNSAAGGGGGSDYLDVSSSGTAANAIAAESIAIGAGSLADTAASSGIAIGFNSDVDSANGIAIGAQSDVTGDGGVAVGLNASSSTNSLALGNTAVASANSSAIGSSANTTATGAIQLGAGTNSTADNLQFQTSAIAHGTFGIKANSGASNPVGAGLEAGTLFLNTSSTQLNYYNGTTWEPAAASPYLAYVSTTYGLTPSDLNGDGNLLLGGNTVATAAGEQTVIGADSESASIGTVILGFQNDAIGDYSIAIGHTADTAGNQSIAIGRTAGTGAADAVAVGANANADALNCVQLGAGTNATANTVQYLSAPIAGANGVIVKTTSGAPVAPAETGTANFDPTTNILYIYNGTAWVSTTLT